MYRKRVKCSVTSGVNSPMLIIVSPPCIEEHHDSSFVRRTGDHSSRMAFNTCSFTPASSCLCFFWGGSAESLPPCTERMHTWWASPFTGSHFANAFEHLLEQRFSILLMRFQISSGIVRFQISSGIMSSDSSEEWYVSMFKTAGGRFAQEAVDFVALPQALEPKRMVAGREELKNFSRRGGGGGGR